MAMRFPYEDFNEENDNKKELANAAALSVFCNKYEPANKTTMTDLFSTKEIQKLIADHNGYEIKLHEITELLTNMQYTYELEEGNFMWLVKKV